MMTQQTETWSGEFNYHGPYTPNQEDFHLNGNIAFFCQRCGSIWLRRKIDPSGEWWTQNSVCSSCQPTWASPGSVTNVRAMILTLPKPLLIREVLLAHKELQNESND